MDFASTGLPQHEKVENAFYEFENSWRSGNPDFIGDEDMVIEAARMIAASAKNPPINLIAAFLLHAVEQSIFDKGKSKKFRAMVRNKWGEGIVKITRSLKRSWDVMDFSDNDRKALRKLSNAPADTKTVFLAVTLGGIHQAINGAMKGDDSEGPFDTDEIEEFEELRHYLQGTNIALESRLDEALSYAKLMVKTKKQPPAPTA